MLDKLVAVAMAHLRQKIMKRMDEKPEQTSSVGSKEISEEQISQFQQGAPIGDNSYGLGLLSTMSFQSELLGIREWRAYVTKNGNKMVSVQYSPEGVLAPGMQDYRELEEDLMSVRYQCFMLDAGSASAYANGGFRPFPVPTSAWTFVQKVMNHVPVNAQMIRRSNCS